MKFRKKPVVVEVEQFTDENKDRCLNFVSKPKSKTRKLWAMMCDQQLLVETIEGLLDSREETGKFAGCRCSGIVEITVPANWTDKQLESIWSAVESMLESFA